MRWACLLLLVLTACTPKTQWSYQEEALSAHLHYPPENELSGAGVELLKGPFGTVGYTYVTCRNIPPLPEETGFSVVVLKIGEETYPYKAERMEGGQRLLLPDEATEQLLSSLHSEEPVTLYLNGFMSELTSGSGASRLRHILKRFDTK